MRSARRRRAAKRALEPSEQARERSRLPRGKVRERAGQAFSDERLSRSERPLAARRQRQRLSSSVVR